MDRPVSTTVSLSSGRDDASTSGWDAHAVWQERVRHPQLATRRAATTPHITLADRSVGWNPLETWRLRIRRPGKNPG